MPPKVVGPYRIVDSLGTGGVGTVYRAIDKRSGEPVALKLLSTGPALNPRAARRLAREFEALAELSHPNVVRVFDTGVHHGYPYLAMELVEGLTLREYLSLHLPAARKSTPRAALFSENSLSETSVPVEARRPFTVSQLSEEPPSEDPSISYSTGPESVRRLADEADEPDTMDSSEATLPPDADEGPVKSPETAEAPPRRARLDELNHPERVNRLHDVMLQMAQALSYVHGHGLIHRDLKPSNVMVDEDRQVRLMDFGLAKFLADDRAMTGTGRVVGTFRYMAPEQIMGEPLDARSDLYSLGVILYELLAGRPPYNARTPQELWHQVVETDAPSLFKLNAEVNGQLARVAQRLIRKEPDDRFQTAEEVFEALSE